MCQFIRHLRCLEDRLTEFLFWVHINVSPFTLTSFLKGIAEICSLQNVRRCGKFVTKECRRCLSLENKESCVGLDMQALRGLLVSDLLRVVFLVRSLKKEWS